MAAYTFHKDKEQRMEKSKMYAISQGECKRLFTDTKSSQD